MAFGDVIQAAEATGSGASINATFGSTPTEGNRLFAVVMTGAADVTSVVSNSNSWTLARKCQTGSSENDACALYYRDAASSEATTVTFTPSASDEVAIQIFEIEGPFAAGVDGTPSSPAKATGASYDCGTTTTSVADAFLVAFAFTRDASNGGTLANSWSDSFVGSTELTNTQTSNKSISHAKRLVTATGTYGSTVTWTTSALAMGAVAAFAKSGGGSPDVTVGASGSALTGGQGSQAPVTSVEL